MSSTDSFIGKQVDQFSIEGFIARGAMGMVYKAFDSVLARTVALKLIPKPGEEELTDEEAACREEARKRLIQEAKAAGRLTHPNIVTIHSYGETPEFQYICMEYVSGKTLAQILKTRNLIPEEEAVSIFEQILLALEAAGREGIIHRDIKPANIMITDDGRVKVMDFGIAKLPTLSMTVTGMVLGTPYYMSPEQISGSKVDIRSDIFSFGAVCYEMLTGRKPFEGQNTATITYKIVQMEPVPPNVLNSGISPQMAAVIAKALAKDPAARYETPAQMLRDLRSIHRKKEEEEPEAEKTVFAATVLAPKEPGPGPKVEETEPAPHTPPAGPETQARHAGTESPVEPEAPRPPEPEQVEARDPSELPATGEHKETHRVAKKEHGKGPVEPRGKHTGAKVLAAAVALLAIGAVVYLFMPAKKVPPRATVPPTVSVPKTIPVSPPTTRPAPVTPSTTVPATVPSTVPPTVPTTLSPPTTVPATVPPPTTRPVPVTPSITVPATVPTTMPPPATRPPVLPPPATVPAQPSLDSMLLDAGRQFVNNPGGAQKILEDVLSRSPENYDATVMLARLQTFRKDYKNALVQYRKAVRLNPKAPELYFEQGSIQLSQSDYDGAIQSLETCLTLSPLNRDDVLASLGFCYLQKNNPEKARALLQKALELNPGNATAKSFMMSLPPVAAPQPPTRPTQPQPPPVPKRSGIEGTYTVEGFNPSGTVYHGKVTIRRSGNNYAVEWQIGKQTAQGTGILAGNTFKVSYKYASGTTGSGVYTLMANGVLRGSWGKTGKGTETLTPVR